LDISLEELMNIKVRTATKQIQQLSKTPAIVSVVTKLDIETWGYQSVGEALKQVPGLYAIHDYVGYNYGVRGINGGQRGYSKIVKLMINGVAIPFRADSTNFLGPELIPIEAVERIEVVRGPGSALYGENAFLGVINVITKSSESDYSQLQLNVGSNQYTSLSGILSKRKDRWGFTLSADISRYNYDDLSLPSSSPSYELFDQLESNNADVRPTSLFIELGYDMVNASQKLMLSYSRKDAVAEFIDFGTLSHENRISLDQSLLNYNIDWHLNEKLDLKSSLSYSNGKPSSKERLSLGDPSVFPHREFEFNAYELNTELHFNQNTTNSIIFGIDYIYDEESLIQVFSVDASTGNQTALAQPRDDVVLKNIGAFVQWQKNIKDNQAFTFNIRNDDHNIYGSNLNYRLGYVANFTEKISSKFLLGSSYKAPAAMQLYAQPIYPGEVIGNANLLPEEAITLESELLWKVSSELAINFNFWITEIKNKVELLPFGPNVQPQNSGKQEGSGIETEVKWIRNQDSLIVNLAYQDMLNETDILFQAPQVAPTSMYPKLTSFIRYRYLLDETSSWGVTYQYSSERRATNSNIRENLLQPYQLPEYSLVGLSYSKRWGNTRFQLKVDNLFDQDFVEPGFLGIDIPGLKQQISLGITYEVN
ncbi:MAG: TonB-dependent receptor, partial [Kangiellaceae bacterium]|nr:TonB-dependent receptor [Kangiellaceae bacterium]